MYRASSSAQQRAASLAGAVPFPRHRLADVPDRATSRTSSAVRRYARDQGRGDRSFVSALVGDSPHNALSLIRTVITLGRNLGLRVVAEGIETTEQRDELKQSGCHVGQGYLFSRPLPSQGVTALLSQATQDSSHPPKDRGIVTVDR